MCECEGVHVCAVSVNVCMCECESVLVCGVCGCVSVDVCLHARVSVHGCMCVLYV